MRRFLCVVILCLLTLPIAVAQDGTTLTYGETIVGVFTDDSPTWTVGFDGTAGDVIYISALDNIVPVEFILEAPDASQLAQSDNAMILNVPLDTDGRYTIQFMRPEWSEDEGEFAVHLGLYELESLTSEGDGSTLVYNGNLADAGALRQFAVDLNEGDLATLILFGANVSMMVESPVGDILIFEGAYNDPEIPLFYFPVTGTYTITVLTTEPGGGTDIAFYLHLRDVVPVTTNERLTGQIVEDLPTVFAFETPADKMWDINAVLPLTGERFISVYQFDGRDYWATQIETDWGTGPDGQPRIRPFIPADDSTYYIALWYDDWETEYDVYDYELIVSPSTLFSIPNNSPLEGTLSSETGDVSYAYAGTAGDRIRVTLTKTSDEGALALSIYSSEDEVITFSGRNATAGSFDIELPLDGFYEFIIFNYDYDFESILGYEILIEPLSD